MEQNETIKEAVVREFLEETALNIHHPDLVGAFTFSIFSEGVISDEWMMFTFVSESFDGQITEQCAEGDLEWVQLEQIHTLPMAEGDQKIFEHVLASKAMLYGSFSYTKDYELLDLRLDPLDT